MAKHKIACISLTVRDRAILSKFSTHRVSKECTNVNFQKIFPSPKMADIFKCSLHVFLMCQTIVRQKVPAQIELHTDKKYWDKKYHLHFLLYKTYINCCTFIA